MSRRIDTSLATIQFQVNARQANAAMQALQDVSNDLNRAIDSVNRNIANLGKDIPKDNPQLLNYQNQLAGLKKDLKDVEKAQRDFLKGAKAADQLWKAAQEGNIESLSFRSIKAGVNGLKKRQEGLRPGDAQDMKDWRIIKEVIDEADRVVKQAGADVQNVVQTIREGGKVSEQAMRQTISTLKELKGSVDETEAEYRTYGNDLDFMEAKLQEFSDAQRRAKGEIVDANDARREMNKLTEEGAAAAKRETEEADRLVASLKQESEELVRKRGEIKQNIEDTQKQIDENHKLIEEKHRQLAADEEAFNAEQQGRRETIDGLKQQAEAERKLANEKSDAAETHRRAAELQAQTTEQLTEKVTELQGKLAELNAEPVKPKVDASEIEKLEAELARLKRELEGVRSYREAAEAKKEAAQQALGGKDIWENERYIKAREEDVAASQAAVKKLDDKWDAYWSKQEDNAKKFAEVLKKSLEDVTYEDFQKHITGPNAELAKSWYRKTTRDNEGLEIWTDDNQKGRDIRYFRDNKKLGLATPEQLEELKLLEGLKRKWDEYWKARDKAEGDRSRSNAVFDELDKYKTESIRADVAIEAATKKAVEIKQQIVEKEKQIAQAQQQSTTATKSEAEALKELEDAQKQLTGRKNWLSQQEGYLKEHLDVLKQIGLKEEDLADEGKVREAVEKKVLEIMQAQANVEKEVAEQQQKMIAGLKDNALGGTKADHDYYLKNRGNYNLEDYATPDDVMERIAHLEMVSKLKNGKKFSDETSWDPDDELDEDEAIVMNDKERENIKNELRILKQHVREEIIKAIREAGDIDKGVENATGGDGVSEDARFGEELNDKISALKDKIHENIKTTVESYSDLLDEDIDREIPMTKEELTSRIKGIVSYTGESLASDRESIGWAKEDVQDAEALVAAKQKQVDAIKAGTQATAESNKKAEEELRLKGELETAQGKLAESKKRENEEQQEYVKLQGEAIEQGNKAAAAETKLADAQSDATQKQADFNQKQQEGLDAINQVAQGNQALQQSIDGLNGELEQNSKDITDNANKATEAEQQKQQARQLSIKRMEEMLAALKEEYYTEELTAEKREEHKQKIKELDEALRLAKGEWMSYGDAMKYANSIGSEGFMATDEQTKMATDALTRHREELIKTIQQKEADSQATAAERAELEQLDQALTKIKTGFASADDVLARWAEHMNAGKTASEGMAQTLDEKLAGATSSFDGDIKRNTEWLEELEEDIKKTVGDINDLEKELAELEQKHANSSRFRKITFAYRREESRIKEIRHQLDEPMTRDIEGGVLSSGAKAWLEQLKEYKQSAIEGIELAKRRKAEELGLTEQETASEEKQQQAQRLTNEQMQEGIKLLEEEYAKTDHTTEKGIKKRQQLREAIDQMNQELKESTGEWMSVADAMKLAGQAEKNTFLDNDGTGFTASAQDIQKATQALERQRDALLQTIKAKRDNKNLTKEEKAALDQEEAELQDLTNKLKALKFEQDNFNMSQAKMQELMRTPTNAVSLDELRSAIKRADGELKRMEGSLGQNNAQYKAFAEQVRNAKNQLKEMEGQAKATSTAWEKAWSRLKTYVVMYMGFNAVWQKMVGTADDIMQLSDKMGEVRKTTGFTADEVGRLSDNLKRLDVRTPLVQLLEISAKAGQLGLKSEQDVMGFTEAANKLMIALPEMGAEAATEMMKVALATGEVKKIQDQLNQGIVEGSSATEVALSKIGSTIDQLRANSAAAAPQITDFVKRVGAVGAQAGISIDQIAALGATVDAVGLRVEMSATALSRMIPAIKNNAFAVAKAIGVTPETLRSLFETGRGMEAILMIFQHIKDANMDSDSIESMLGMGNMKEIMKELNQMGARAGIVFSGLSQNVDELRRQLNVAGDAYKQNIAIQQEYEKMNETTAAKWERLKNQVEEMFVGDETQSWLGHIIDGLRTIVDLLAGPLSGAFKGALGGIASYSLGLGSLLEKLKDFAMGEEDISEKIKGWWDKLKEGNAWDIVVSGTIAAGFALYEYLDSLKEAAREVARFNEELVNEQNKVEDLTKSITAANANVEEAEKDVAKAREEVEKAKKALDEAKKSTDDTKEATDKLAEAESKLIVEEEKKRNSMAEQKKLVEQFNSLYSKYLGFMISEISSTNELNKARDLLNTKLRETITLKRKEAALSRLEESEGEGRDEAYSELSLALGSAFRKQVVVGHDKDKKEIKAWTEDRERNAALLREVTALAQSEKLTAKQVEEALAKAGLSIYETGRNGEKRISAYGANIRNLVMNYRKEYKSVQKKVDEVMIQFDVEASLDRKESQEKLSEQYKASAGRYGELEKEYANATGKAKKQAAANLLKQADTLEEMITAAPNYYDLNNEAEKTSYEKFVKDTQARIDGIKDQRETLIKEAGNAYQARKTVSGDMTTGGGGEKPWGSRLPAESTAYADMSADVLVNRRKQMKDFVNAIQTDTDVQSVLKEDAALKKAIENGMSSDMRTVIEWYNTERLKIQDELHARHLTNTGDWMDPKKQRGAHKQFRDEMDAYLHELDAYYTERKTRIEEAGTDEGLTEAEIKNRTLNNEMEWQQRRAELQKLYSRKQKEVTEEELNAIYHIIAERTGDSEKFVKAQIAKTNQFVDSIEKSGEKGAAIVHRWMSQVELDTERSYLKGQQALTKQMRAIEAIIDKERPFNGITKSLQESLATMDILTGEMRKEYNELMKQGKNTADFNARQHQEEMKRTAFLLGEAENAYSTTIDRVMDDMRKKDMTAWADWLSADPKLQEALMAQLRSTYDAIQDAIKKEASQLKKQAEIMWNNILMPDGKTTLKQQTDRVIAQLGLDEGRVKRANSLIGAGQASERVADKLAIQQMKVQLAMQEHYYNLMKKQGQAHVDMLNAQAKAAKERGDEEEATRKTLDAQHAQMALNLATSKEETELAKQREDIIARTEESQNRLYQELRSWADLLASSLQGVFEASHAGDAEYYNERAKLDLTGKGGPGAGTYIVIDNEGTEDATAHYEYLDERQALERQREIEQQNAQAEAWKKLWDDLNNKMSEQITDWMNAALQDQAVDANTEALKALTRTLSDGIDLNVQKSKAPTPNASSADGNEKKSSTVAAEEINKVVNVTTTTSSTTQTAGESASTEGGSPASLFPTTEEEVAQAQANMQTLWDSYREQGVETMQGMAEEVATIPGAVLPPWQVTEEGAETAMERMGSLWQSYAEQSIAAMQQVSDAMEEIPNRMPDPTQITEEQVELATQNMTTLYDNQAQAQIDASNKATEEIVKDNEKQEDSTKDKNKEETKSTQSAYSKMAAACNMYGLAYQTVTNDNLNASQKFQLFALQAAGQTAIGMLTTDLFLQQGKAQVELPGILGKAASQLGPIAGPIAFAAMTALLGGLMGLAVSQVAKSKSQISQVTGASVGAGRLATGMMTYAEGNVNELTDPSTLTPGRSYNVDGADGHTYRAKYTGKGAKTHITSGPEFHLVGEKGQEAIIDAHTTRNIRLNEPQIWQNIQTLYNGGRLSATRRRKGRGVTAFAEGNLDEFEEIESAMGDGSTGGGIGTDQMMQLQASLDRNSDVLERALTEGIKGVFNVYGKGGLVDSYDTGKKTVTRHGERY